MIMEDLDYFGVKNFTFEQETTGNGSLIGSLVSY
jgi:hypothetical protein